MTALETGRKIVDSATDAAGRTLASARALLGLGADVAGVAVGFLAAGVGRSRSGLEATAAGVERVSGRSVPALPVVGSEGTVLAIALALAAAAAVYFGIGTDAALAFVVGVVGGDVLVRAVVVGGGLVAAWLAWTRSQLIMGAAAGADAAEDTATAGAKAAGGTVTAGARGTRTVVTGLAGAAVSAALAVYLGIVDPLAMLATMAGDWLIGGATAAFAAVTGFATAAGAKATGTGKRGIAVAGTVGAGAAAAFGALAFPAAVVGLSALLTVALDNPFPLAVVGAAFVFFVTDPFAGKDNFTGSLVSIVRAALIALVAFAAVVAFGPDLGPLFAVSLMPMRPEVKGNA